ncbi:MAG TPA: three-Cys-motif partner protein TcmP [Bradyrhizobium sp.]
MAVDHEFGGQHTELKLSIIEKYLQAFSSALRNKFGELWYIDAFAGTGKRTVKVEAKGGDLFEAEVPESVEQRRGSAQIAIDIRPPFHRLIFIESKPRYCKALRELADQHAHRDIMVVEEDANLSIQKELKDSEWKSTRAVLFLDPYGMEVDWETLVAIAATKAIDVWFLFSLSGLYRQATRKSEKITEEKRAALTKMFGSDQWERELYSDQGQGDMFGGGPQQREFDVKGLERYVKSRLETLFPKVFEPLALPVDKAPQRFSLFLCISNDEPRAVGLATKIANHILKAGMAS